MDLIPLLSYIDANINTKTGTDKISGKQHNAVLKEVVNSVIEITGTGFGGDIAPGDNPGAQTNPIYFLASEVGTYTYCGGVQVTALPAFIVWKNNAWSLNQIGIESEETEDTGLRGIAREGDAAPSSPQLGDWYVYIGSETLQWPSQNAINKPGILVLESVNPSANWVLTPFGDESGGGGSITVDSELNDESENPVQNKVLANRTLSSIKPDADKAKKLVIVDTNGNILGYSTFDFDQIFQFGDMDVSDWLPGEKRLSLISNNNGEARLENAAALRDISAPPAVDTKLIDQSGWVNERKTITGENYRGEIGNAGQRRVLSEGSFFCESSTRGTEGGNNGSSTWVRNRAVDVINPDNNAQDSTICDNLNPMRTGGNSDDGWDLGTNTKVLTVPAKWGTWWKDTGGYMYFCYAVSGSSSYWWRNGTPQAIYLEIDSISHPILTNNLLNHDFTTNRYSQQVGDEMSYWGQIFYDKDTRQEFKKVSSTEWEKYR